MRGINAELNRRSIRRRTQRDPVKVSGGKSLSDIKKIIRDGVKDKSGSIVLHNDLITALANSIYVDVYCKMGVE